MRAFRASAENPPNTTLCVTPAARRPAAPTGSSGTNPHIDDGAVAGFEAAALQHVGEAAHQAVQLL